MDNEGNDNRSVPLYAGGKFILIRLVYQEIYNPNNLSIVIICRGPQPSVLTFN